MCEEDIEELECGNKAAILLAEHLERTGADKITIPILTDAGCYQIIIVKTM